MKLSVLLIWFLSTEMLVNVVVVFCCCFFLVRKSLSYFQMYLKCFKMPDFDVFSLLEIRKRKSRSHGIRKKGNSKRKKRAVKRSNTSLKDLSKVLEDHGRHSMLSFLSSLPISVLRI